ARDVRAPQPELAGRAQEVRERARRSHRERRPAAVAGRGHLRAVPQGDAKRALGERRGECVTQRRRAHGTISLRAWRSGATRTTSQASPAFSRTQMTIALGSTSQRRCPWAAEVGNAWWLLCQASPNVISDSHARLRDSSSVAKRRRPKKWHSELMLN